MGCYRKILCISYKDHITNEEVCAKIQQAIGPHYDLTIEKRHKLKWYVHVSRSSGLAKAILKLREMDLSFQAGFNLVNATTVCAILESISALEPTSDITEPRYLKLVTVSSFCPFTFISLSMPLV